MKIMPQSVLAIACSLAILSNPISASSTTASPSIQPPPAIEPAATTTNGNPVFQLAGYLKDSCVRMKDGSIQLFTNHKRCNEIRAKQKAYLAMTAATLPENEQKAARKYHMGAGGITYDEFHFLMKGQDDRAKLSKIGLMMFLAPNFVPYAFMFFPDMLPSPFAMPANKMGLTHSKWDQISRERCHAVVQAMLDLEKAARVAPMMSNLNPFGKGKTRRMMEGIDRLGHDVGGLLMADNARGSEGAQLVAKVLKDEFYSDEKPKKKATTLAIFPKGILTGLCRALEPTSFNSLIPTFIMRGQVLNILRQIETSDRFLVDQNIDLTSLSSEHLQEVCSARLIGGLGRSDEELIEGLSTWLELVVKQPEELLKGNKEIHYNANFARAAIMCYNAVDGARDARSTSYLPRLLYQGQYQPPHQVEDDSGSKRKWINRSQ